MSKRIAPSSRFRQLVSESGLYILGNVLRRSFSVITMPVFTRYLSPTGYGVIAIVGTVQNMLEVFYEMGVSSAATRFYYDCRTRAEQQALFGTLLAVSLAGGAILTATLLLAGPWLWALVGKDVPFFPYLLLTVGTVVLGSVGVLPRALFRVQNRVPTFFRLSFAQTFLTAGLSVLLVVVFSSGPVGPILATFVVAILFSAVYIYYLWPHIRLTFEWPTARRSLRFGLPDIAMHLGGWALNASSRLILQHFTSLAVVGIYSVGYAVSKMPFDLVGNAIHWAIVPFFYATAKHEPEARSKAALSQVATYNVTILAGLGLVTVMFGRELIEIFASARYGEAASVVPLIVSGAFLQASSYIPSKGIYLREKTAYLPLIVIAGGGVNVLLNFALIPPLGMLGAAWATLAGYVVTLAVILAISQRLYPIPYEYGRIARVVLTAVAVAWLGSLLPPASLMGRLTMKALAVGSFPLLLWLIGFFSEHELRWLRTRLAWAVQGRA